MSKVYMIVTNDKYETPVKSDVIGAKAVAEYMGISESYVRKMLCGYKPFVGKYKAVLIGEANLTEKNMNFYKSVDRSEYYKEYYKKNKHKRKNNKEYRKKYYAENKEHYHDYYIKSKLTMDV